MIRPFTCVCMILAAGSGLYLYQTKHRSQMLDRDIADTVHQAQAARDRSGLLRAEWTLLNDPQRLADLATRFLQLKSTLPPQFTSLADLDKRLPPIGAPDAPAGSTDEPSDDIGTPVASAAPPHAPGGTAGSEATAALADTAAQGAAAAPRVVAVSASSPA
ncbi:cell division protein FtsL, partial [Acidisphaera rubrifaciens]